MRIATGLTPIKIQIHGTLVYPHIGTAPHPLVRRHSQPTASGKPRSIDWNALATKLKQTPAYRSWRWPWHAPSQPIGLKRAMQRAVVANLLALPWVAKAAAYVYFRRYVRRYEVIGQEHLRGLTGRPIIFAANHQSYLDPPALSFAVATTLARCPWSMAKETLYEKPKYRRLFPWLSGLPFDRQCFEKARAQGQRVLMENLEQPASILLGGRCLNVLVEARIPGAIEATEPDKLIRLRSDVNPATGLLEGSPVVFLLALITGAVVVPVGISGAGKALPPEVKPLGLLPKPDRKEQAITVRFGKPLEIRDILTQQAVRSGHQRPLDRALVKATQTVLMPAISALVDHSRNMIPLNLPIDQAQLAQLHAHEERMAQAFECGGNSRAAKLSRGVRCER